MGLNPETENNTTKETAPPGHAETDPAMATPPKTPSKATERMTNCAAKQTVDVERPARRRGRQLLVKVQWVVKMKMLTY